MIAIIIASGILDELDVEAERVPRVEVAEPQAAEPAAHDVREPRRVAERDHRVEVVDEETEMVQTGPVRREELDVQTLTPHRLQQLDLHVAAAREPQRERARHARTTEVVVEIVGRQVHELAATERVAHRALRACEIRHHVRLLEQPVTDVFEQAADPRHVSRVPSRPRTPPTTDPLPILGTERRT